MQLNIQLLRGPWDLGYSLDKHTLHSTYIGDNEFGHPMFDTTRTEIGEALFQLKYRNDYSKIEIIAEALASALSTAFSTASFVVPMPPSKYRLRQPVVEISRLFASRLGIPCIENLLLKRVATPQMKNVCTRAEKVQTLVNNFYYADILEGGLYDAVLFDDLYDTGASLEAATVVLRGYPKIRQIFVATATRKH